MGARPSPVIDAGEQLDSRKVRGHGLLCEHRSALRAPRISPSTDPYRRRAARRHRSHAQGTGRWSGSRYIAIKYLIKLNYFLKGSIAQLNHKLRPPYVASQQFLLQHAILKYIVRDHLPRMGLG